MEENRSPVDTIRRNTLLRLRNLWYFVDLLVQVPRDIILDPLTIGILRASVTACYDRKL